MTVSPTSLDEKSPVRDRQWAIVREVELRQRVNVSELSQKFGVSDVMIRRDLERLDGLGLVRRVHGGAEAVPRSAQPIVFNMRLLRNVAVKRVLGATAARLLGDGRSVFIDSGTTVLEVARHLPRVLPEGSTLTVATRSLVVASEMRTQRNIRLFILGGVYQPDYDTLVGSQAESALEGLHVDTLFMGADGITVERGVSTDLIQEANMYRAMARCAERVVVVADASKIGVHTLQAVLPCEEIDVIVTDSRAPAPLIEAFRERGVEVVVAPAPGDGSAGRQQEGGCEDAATSP
jgi:DeoR family transcriptional regulator, aga operon transcriptional repressor